MEVLRFYNDVSCDNLASWNVIMFLAITNEENQVALNLFHEMCHGYLMSNSYIFPSILTPCCELKEIQIGK